jgi:hypothetical protein
VGVGKQHRQHGVGAGIVVLVNDLDHGSPRQLAVRSITHGYALRLPALNLIEKEDRCSGAKRKQCSWKVFVAPLQVNESRGPKAKAFHHFLAANECVHSTHPVDRERNPGWAAVVREWGLEKLKQAMPIAQPAYRKQLQGMPPK